MGSLFFFVQRQSERCGVHLKSPPALCNAHTNTPLLLRLETSFSHFLLQNSISAVKFDGQLDFDHVIITPIKISNTMTGNT